MPRSVMQVLRNISEIMALIFIVHARRCVISAMHMMVRRFKLSSWRRLLVTAMLLAATTTVLVFAVSKWFFSPPRYAVFGVDRHPSVMRLLESDILVTQLIVDDVNNNLRTAEVVGVFMVVSSSAPQQVLSMLGTGSDLQCLSSYHYQIFLITSATQESSDPVSRMQYGDDVINSAARRLLRGCVEAGAMSVIIWLVEVSGSIAPPVVADLVTEAYIDNITWYDFIFLPRMTSSFPVWDRWPPTELSPPLYVGAAVKTDSVGTRFSFHRTHLDIFGDSWPRWTCTGTDVARYLKDVYADVLYNPSSTLDVTVRNDQVWLQRYVDAMKASPQWCLPCQLKHEMTAGSRKVISMSLYGSDPRYTIGAVRNAQRLPVIFAGWRLRFYYQDGSVLRQLVDKLRGLGAELKDVTMIPEVAELAPMLWRMTALDDPSVDVVLSRDADSRLTDRDTAAVSDWLSADSHPAFHCVRDHPSHALFSVNGGLWGARRHPLLDLLGGQPLTPLMADFGSEYMDDMRFLELHVWLPLATLSRHEIYCHDSVSCDQWVGAHRFPVVRHWPGEHVGQVFDAWSRPRQGDVNLLLSADRNIICEPEPQLDRMTLGPQAVETPVY